jgi:CBS domain-containing protein
MAAFFKPRTPMKIEQGPRLMLRCELKDACAQDLMTPNPVFIRGDATFEEAIRFLADKGISGLVVIGDSGRPLGVLSATDLLIHERAKLGTGRESHAERGQMEVAVKDIMTPAVFSVRLETPASQVIEQMTALNVHRLFVVDDSETVVGVISALDILRHLN